jgi:HD-GYP domain-containing protein (c-di-GMP phosphodiesterase class II)
LQGVVLPTPATTTEPRPTSAEGLDYCRSVSGPSSSGDQQICAAEVIAALSLATDLSIGFDFEHGLRSTLVAARLAERLGVHRETASQTYYACLLQQVGCTADIHVRAKILGDTAAAVRNQLMPVWFGEPREMMTAMARSVAPHAPLPVRVIEIARKVPTAARVMPRVDVACREVARMLIERLGLPASIGALFAYVDERWDGKGAPGAKGDEIPLAMRIAHVARDIDVQRVLGGTELAARVVGERAGSALDPAIAARFVKEAPEILAIDDNRSVWEQTLACEPAPRFTLEGAAIDRALSAMGDFADLVCPHLAGHSAGVAELASAGAQRCHFDAGEVTAVRRAALVHDVGRVAVPVPIWQKPGPLTAGEWERVRLHPYHSERVLSRSPFLAALGPVATSHHERLDGSGYHRGAVAGALSSAARVLAAADAYHAMTEPRPHRKALPKDRAAATLGEEARAGRLDADAVGAVLEAAGHQPPRIERPAGLTEREVEVVALLARGLQTKQVAHALGISVKTADRHVQNSYRKIGVSTRAAAALFAMEHGLTGWGELPIGSRAGRS